MTNGAPLHTQNKRSPSIKSSEILFGHDRLIHIAFKKSYCWKLHDMYRSFVGSKWKEANVTIWLNAYGHFRSSSHQTKDSIYWFIFSRKIGLQSQAIMVHSYALMRPDFFLFATEFLQWKEQKWRKKNCLKPSRFAERSVFKSGFCCCYVFLGEIIIKFVWNFQKSSFIVRLTERSLLLQFVFFLDFRITIFKANIGKHFFWQLCH